MPDPKTHAEHRSGADLDASLQTAGNGVFGTVASVAGSVITLANTPFGARLLHENQNVQVYDEANGITIYSVTLQATKTGSNSGQTYMVNLTFAADQNGNPTVPPVDGGFGDTPIPVFAGNFGRFSGVVSTTASGGSAFFGVVHGRRGWF